MADPGFPVGGGGGGHIVAGANFSMWFMFCKILYVKAKESVLLGGARRVRPLDPPLQTIFIFVHV